jgi:surface polysaccharide O-acyltransferase-like enzyme
MNPKAVKIRNEAIDQGRFFAAAGVVWIHSMHSDMTSNWGELGRFAVPFFLSLAILMTWQSLQRTSADTSFISFFMQRLRRLYLPMLVWSSVYIALKWVKGILQPDAPNDYPGLSLLWGETAYHLWFIPFLILVTMLLFMSRQIAEASDQAKRILAIVLMSIAVLVAAVPEIHVPVKLAGLQWMWRATPAVISAFVLFALLDARPNACVIAPRWTRIAGMVGVAALFLAVIQPGSIILETIAGLMFLILVLNEEVHWKNAPLLSLFGRISMGIYFCHLLFVKCSEIVLDRIAHEPAAWKDGAVFVISLSGAIGLSYLLYRFQPTRSLVA